jgi:signal transduction histidine kinase
MATATFGPPRQRSRRLADRLRHGTSFSLLTRVVVGSIVLSVLVVGAFSTLLVATSHLRSSTDQQAQSRSITEATLGLERVVNQLEVSLRSFVISKGDDRFLASWRQGRSQLPTAIAAVEHATAGQPARARQLAELSTLIHAYVGEYGLPLIAIAHLSPEAARAPVATREGVLRINAIRNDLSKLVADEDGLASANAAAAKQEASHAERVGIGVLVATGVLLVLFATFLARGIARPVRTVAAGASRVAGGDLSTRLPEDGAAEIATLTRSFNAMAGSLEQSKRELEAQNDELRHSQRLMSQLVRIVSHELRTPLASIIGYASLLRTRRVPQETAAHYLEIIHDQGTRLETIVDKFLDGEGIEAGKVELQDEPLDLKTLLLDEVRMVSSSLTRHRIEVEIEPGSLPVRGDGDRLGQVIVNLLTNAVKYSPDGGVVEVRGTIERGAVHVEVRDEGLGIAEEYQAQIFTKFFRGDAGGSGIAGTGLGLAVSREIVEAHGGRIGFTSKAGEGSTFWLELPLAAAPDVHAPGAGALTGFASP